jgi:hypothetical protein
MIAWVIKLVSGWLPISGDKIGKIIWVAGLFIAFQFVFHKVFNTADSQTTQRATKGGVVSSTTIAPHVSPGGCAHIQVSEK